MDGEGMMALVRSLKDAGLAVTLLDSQNKYTLMPSHKGNDDTAHDENLLSTGTGMQDNPQNLRDISTQVTDGNYATTYRVCHCHVKPTSPPIELPEFPPQKVDLYPGENNFEVGGQGSGESYQSYPYPVRPMASRGPQNLCNRVCFSSRPSRPSREPSAFANSLRKYPNMSPDRSTEFVERILNYTQNKGSMSSRQSRSQYHTPREYNNSVDYNRRRFGDQAPTSPSRDGPVKGPNERYKNNGSSYRNTSDMQRKPSPVRSPSPNKSLVDSGVQVTATRLSKDITTTPVPKPLTKNVAIFQSPTCTELVHPGVMDQPLLPRPTTLKTTIPNEKQTAKINHIPLKIHESASSTNHSNTPVINVKKSSSEALLSRTVRVFESDLRDWLKEVISDSDVKTRSLTDNVLKKLRNLSHKNSMGRHVRFKVCKYNRDAIREKFYNEIMNVKDNPDNTLHLTLNRAEVNECKPSKANKAKSCPSRKGRQNKVIVTSILKEHIKCDSELKSENLESIYDYGTLNCHDEEYNPINEALVTRLEGDRLEDHEENIDPRSSNEIEDCDLKLYISNTISEFLGEIKMELKPKIMNEVLNRVFDVITLNNDTINDESYSQMQNDVLEILHESDLSEHQADCLTEIILDSLNGYFTQQKASKLNTLSYIIYNTTNSNNTTNMISISGISQADINANLDNYITEIAKEIDKWLTSLKLPEPEDSGFREVVINDLATDIVDKQKYLQLNLSGPISEEEELEHLKCQIFKWINKLVGEDRFETIEKASDLMRGIQRLPVPMLRRPPNSGVNVPNSNDKNNFEIKDITVPSSTISSPVNMSLSQKHPNQNTNNNKLNVGPKGEANNVNNNQETNTEFPNMLSNTTDERSLSPLQDLDKDIEKHYALPRYFPNKTTKPKLSIQEINQQFDEYLFNWIQRIPIRVTNYEEQNLAEKARLDIRNGVLKAVAKMNLHPGSANNSVYYQDLLDEEIENLFACLPQIPELESRKPVLKSSLLKVTKEIYDQLKDNDSYTQNLIKQIKHLIPRKVVRVPNESLQEYLILYIAENYILSKNYAEIDKVKAEVYRNKLSKYAMELFEELKRSKCLVNEQMDYQDMHNIVQSLDHVPLPSDEILRNEVDEILLGLEIENWCIDLPIKSNDDRVEQLQRRRLREALTKKLHRIENDKDLEDDSVQREIQLEIFRFLQIVPLKEDEDLNLSFMVNELTNRLRNRQRAQASFGGRKSVSFQEPIAYEHFGQSLPPFSHSSFAEQPQPWLSSHHGVAMSRYGNESAPGLSNYQESGNMGHNSIVRDPQGYRTFGDFHPISSTLQSFGPFSRNAPIRRQNFDGQQPSYYNQYMPDMAGHYKQAQDVRRRTNGEQFFGPGSSGWLNSTSQGRPGNFPMMSSSLMGNIGSTLHEPSSYLKQQYQWTTLPPLNPNQSEQSAPFGNPCCQNRTAKSPNIKEAGFVDITVKNNTSITEDDNALDPVVPPNQYLRVPPRNDPDTLSLMTSIGNRSPNRDHVFVDRTLQNNNTDNVQGNYNFNSPAIPPNHHLQVPHRKHAAAASPTSSVEQQFINSDPNQTLHQNITYARERQQNHSIGSIQTDPNMLQPIHTSTPRETSDNVGKMATIPQRSIGTQVNIHESVPTESKETNTGILFSDANASPFGSRSPMAPPLRRTMKMKQFPKSVDPQIKPLEYSEEEVAEYSGKCHCSERWRRRRTPSCLRNEDCDLDLPYCFPIRYPYPYYY